MADANIIVAVDHAIDVIEYLFSVKQEASIREISVATGMSNSSVHRQLLTLKERGYVYQNPETLKYWLGMRFYALGNLVKSNVPLVNLLSAALDALAEKYGLTTYLVLPDYSSDLCAQQAIVYKKNCCPMMLRNESSIGTILLSHASATGKCMLAYYPETLIEKYRKHPLVKLTDNTITDWNTLLAECATIRSRGYALDSEEELLGRTCLAVPVLNSQNEIIASISLSGQTKSIFEHPVNQLVDDLLSVAAIAVRQM